jgi:hypothetical protein
MQTNQNSKRESLWARIFSAWTHSFDLLAESKSRFPMEF